MHYRHVPRPQGLLKASMSGYFTSLNLRHQLRRQCGDCHNVRSASQGRQHAANAKEQHFRLFGMASDNPGRGRERKERPFLFE